MFTCDWKRWRRLARKRLRSVALLQLLALQTRASKVTSRCTMYFGACFVCSTYRSCVSKNRCFSGCVLCCASVVQAAKWRLFNETGTLCSHLCCLSPQLWVELVVMLQCLKEAYPKLRAHYRPRRRRGSLCHLCLAPLSRCDVCPHPLIMAHRFILI